MKNEVHLLYRYTGKTHEDHESLYFIPFYDTFSDEVVDDIHTYFVYAMKDEDKANWRGEGSPLEISYMESIITKLKEEGATHMEIMFHTDHDSYCISGVEIRIPTQEEIDQYNVNYKAKKEKELMERKKRIQQAMDEINKELEKLG